MKPIIEDKKDAARCVVLSVIFVVILALLTGCKTIRYIPVETVRTDTVSVIQAKKDSIYRLDSVFVARYEKGETIYIDKTKYVKDVHNVYLHDTIYRATHDTVPKKVEVPAKTSWIDKMKIDAFPFLIVAIWFIVLFMYLTRKR